MSKGRDFQDRCLKPLGHPSDSDVSTFLQAPIPAFPIPALAASSAIVQEPSALVKAWYVEPKKERTVPVEPTKKEPDVPAKKPDIQPEPRPEEIPQDKDVPEKESPPMQL